MLTSLTRSLAELWTRRDLLQALAGRELKSRYRRSSLGFLWSLITPAFQIGVFTFVIHMLGNNEKNLSFKILTGIIPWTFFSTGVLNSCAAILRYRNVVKKVYFPRQMLVLSVVAANLVHLLLSVLVMLVIFLLRPVAFFPEFFFLVPLIVLELILVSGLSLIACTAHTFFGDVEYLLTVIMQPFMFIVPVVYRLDYLDRYPPLWQMLYKLNPLAILIDGWDAVLLRHQLPDPFWLGVTTVTCLLVFVVGLAVWQRYEWRFPEVI